MKTANCDLESRVGVGKCEVCLCVFLYPKESFREHELNDCQSIAAKSTNCVTNTILFALLQLQRKQYPSKPCCCYFLYNRIIEKFIYLLTTIQSQITFKLLRAHQLRLDAWCSLSNQNPLLELNTQPLR